ncbi:MAG: hypothetical protein U0939_14025 [Pirellulales bacterium]
MARNIAFAVLCATLTVVWCGSPADVANADDAELGRRASWSTPSLEQVKAELDGWLAGRSADEATRQRLASLFPPGEVLESPELLDRVATAIGDVDPAAKTLLESIQADEAWDKWLASPLLADAKTPSIVRNNLRLYAGRHLAQRSLYDEALELLAGVEPNQVVDPASLLFYRSVSHHRLLDKDKCLPALAQLMENEKAIPRRYLTLAKLMDADLRPLKADSLDEIARLMDDVHRRLDLGRAGKKVRQEEDDVIAKLDKMIEELEEQLKQQQQQAGAAGGSANPSSPRADSTPGGVKGPGNVDPKDIGRRADWGDLPPKERQEVLQQIGKDLPAHYRETIEEYFRKLARDGVKK